MAGRRTAVLLVITLLGLIALGVYSSGRFGPAMTAQIAVSFAIPALVMVFFWRAARSRLHAREDEMKISVFTGPYFADSDPEMYRVRIPIAFWKVIAFIHDRTGELCATGYEMNQEMTLQPEEEFVFGAFTSPQLGIATQVPIGSIEARSGISFGKLAAVDPLTGEEESLTGVAPVPLLALEQIRFVR